MDLPPDLASFVTDAVDSVAELEALLLVYRERGQPWTVARLAARLYIDEGASAAVVEALSRRQFMRPVDSGFAFSAPSGEAEAHVKRLAASYARLLIPITRLIHDKPSAAVRGFADAFRLREKRP
jgi:hypothetical protein